MLHHWGHLGHDRSFQVVLQGYITPRPLWRGVCSGNGARKRRETTGAKRIDTRVLTRVDDA